MKHKLGLMTAIAIFALVFFASAAPIPLYGNYVQTLHLSTTELSLSSVCYFAGTMMALLFFARLSNIFGRKPVIVVTILLSMAGLVAFLMLNSAYDFLFARFIQGISCGMASSCVAAYIVDTASPKLAMVAVSTTAMIGLCMGSLGAGISKQYLGTSTGIYWLGLGLLVTVFVMILFAKETVAKQPDAIKKAIQSLVPTIGLPIRFRPFLPAATCVFLATWAIGGFFQTFSASIAKQQLHSSNVLTASAIFALFQLPSLLGSMTSNHIGFSKAQKIGLTGFLLSFIFFVWTMTQGWLLGVLIFTASASLTFGLAYTSSLQSLVADSQLHERAGILSLIYIIGYGGAAIPNLLVAKFAKTMPLVEIASIYAVFVGLMWLVMMIVGIRECQLLRKLGTDILSFNREH